MQKFLYRPKTINDLIIEIKPLNNATIYRELT